MAQMVRDVMTKHPIALPAKTTLVEAARRMKEHDIGDVIVMKDDGQVCGIVTDRDIVVRAIADGKDPSQSTIGEVCSRDVISVSPDDPLATAVELMRQRAVRRLPVEDKGVPVGIVSLGDLAQNLDRGSALGEISAQPPNN